MPASTLAGSRHRSSHSARPSKLAIAREALGRLSWAERALLRLSKHPHDVEVVADYGAPGDRWNLGNALSSFETAFPGFIEQIQGQRVLDYGCGDGFQSVALAQAGARAVVGAEVSDARLGNARKLAASSNATDVEFTRQAEGAFDSVISLDAVEHFVRPEDNLREMASSLAPGGKIYVTFGPPWFAPFGHHMHFFTRAPWINLVFSERTVYRVRSLYRTDGFTTYSPDLNRMTVTKFEKLLKRCGLRAESLRYRTVMNLPIVNRIPILRELFVNQIDALLVPR
jgi:SAM-dependent methyltransferase